MPHLMSRVSRYCGDFSVFQNTAPDVSYSVNHSRIRKAEAFLALPLSRWGNGETGGGTSRPGG